MESLRVDSLSPEDARELLRRACGSPRWVERMLARRPFGALAVLLDAARAEWFSLSPADWRQAFADHPRIGDRESLARRFPLTHQLSSQEQAGVAGASEDVLTALADANEVYLQKFGYIFIICASGQDATTMLRRMRERINNDPEIELRIAAGEQAKITALRLDAAG